MRQTKWPIYAAIALILSPGFAVGQEKCHYGKAKREIWLQETSIPSPNRICEVMVLKSEKLSEGAQPLWFVR